MASEAERGHAEDLVREARVVQLLGVIYILLITILLYELLCYLLYELLIYYTN